KELVEIAGATIVSGMAEGIDSVAQWATLNAGGKTVAVLGNGIDKIYPLKNLKLYEAIKERGCIISEFPLGCQSYGRNFPRRNRLMSALGRGIIVIEAHRGSGVFHTVSHGLDQGKDIFAFPGSVFEPGSYASHFFIKEGTAKPVFTTADIIEEYFDMDLLCRDAVSGVREIDLTGRDPEERLILEALVKGELSFDAICRRVNLTSAEVNSLLALLEVEGLVAKRPGQIYGLANYIDEVDNE
ncbi:MAG: DNA-processing protein DprA, partial [Bacillota bacterium]|nr:DNA-processing protein DprA [Bacillota bacterium]